MPFLGDVLQNTANTLHGWGVNTPEMGWTESAGNTGGTAPVSYKLPDINKTVWSNGALKGEQTFYDRVYNFDGSNVRYLRDVPKNSGGNVTEDNGAVGYTGSSGYTGGGGGGGGAPAYTAADERAAYDDQINAIKSLLGYAETQKAAGLSSMADKYNYEKSTLDAQRQRAMNDYQLKSDENSQSKERGLGEVDSFANNSYNNLRRLLQGGNAGNSSVARELMPYLVSKAATTRRTGVFDTAGRNDRSIATAKDDAEYQYGVNSQDLSNSRKSNEQSFQESILNRQNDLASQQKELEIKRAMANGSGYAAARSAGDAAQAGITDRQNQLAALFGQYKPSFTARAITAKTPELGQYTVDKAQIASRQSGLPTESSYYLQQLKKKNELGL